MLAALIRQHGFDAVWFSQPGRIRLISLTVYVTSFAMKPIPINEKLVWDYDIPADAQENEAFLRWYIARVLSHGTAEDLRAIGLATIHDYLPNIVLPKEILDFWQWYFGQEHVRERYGDLDSIPAATA